MQVRVGRDAAAPLGAANRAGEQIGYPGRPLNLAFVIMGSLTAVGCLIAAQATRGFGGAQMAERRVHGIFGTFACFGWAFLAAKLTMVVRNDLPGLGIADLLP